MNKTDIRHIPTQVQKGTAAIPERLKTLDAHGHFAVLATDDNGRPYTSLVAYALTPDMRQLVFATPKKTRKYANIIRSSNVALLSPYDEFATDTVYSEFATLSTPNFVRFASAGRGASRTSRPELGGGVGG